MDLIITLLPAAMVSVFCVIEVAINSVPAGPLIQVLPMPVMLSTVITPSEIISPGAVLLFSISNERLVINQQNDSHEIDRESQNCCRTIGHQLCLLGCPQWCRDFQKVPILVPYK